MIFSFFKALKLRNRYLYQGIVGHILQILTEDEMIVIATLMVCEETRTLPEPENDPLMDLSPKSKQKLINIFLLCAVPNYFKVGGGGLRYDNWFALYKKLGFTDDQAIILSGVKWLKFDRFVNNPKKYKLSPVEQEMWRLELVKDLREQELKQMAELEESLEKQKPQYDRSTAPQHVRDTIKGALRELLEEENEDKE